MLYKILNSLLGKRKIKVPNVLKVAKHSFSLSFYALCLLALFRNRKIKVPNIQKVKVFCILQSPGVTAASVNMRPKTLPE